MWVRTARTCGRPASWVRGARVRLVVGLSDVTRAYTTRGRISRIIHAPDLTTCTTSPQLRYSGVQQPSPPLLLESGL